MNCSLNSVYAWISAAIATLAAAVVAALFFVTAVPLFIAAALVAVVAYVLIPQIKSALQAYGNCRGPVGKCPPISLTIDTLGQAAATLSALTFIYAAVLELGVAAVVGSWIFSWLAPTLQAAVVKLVHGGCYGCAITALILIGVLSNAISFQNCMNQQSKSPGGSGSALQ